LIRVKEKERPYLLFGALEMLHYDWIINTDGMRVYAKRREPQPKIYTHMRSSFLLHAFPVYFGEAGFLAFPIPHGALWRAGMHFEEPCRILTVNGVNLPSKLEGTTSKQMVEELTLLAESPFTETVHLRLPAVRVKRVRLLSNCLQATRLQRYRNTSPFARKSIGILTRRKMQKISLL
jgi:hypothetical protein